MHAAQILYASVPPPELPPANYLFALMERDWQTQKLRFINF